MFRELACTVKRDNLTHDFLLDKTPGPIARCAFFLREKLFDAVIIQRGHVVGTRSHARKFNERPMRRQRSPARLSLVSSRSEVETSLDGCEKTSTAFRRASLRSEQTVIARRSARRSTASISLLGNPRLSRL